MRRGSHGRNSELITPFPPIITPFPDRHESPAPAKAPVRRYLAAAGFVSVLFVIALAIVVVSTAESAAPRRGRTDSAAFSMHPQFALTRQPLQAAAAAVTATPTPRVIVIQPTPTATAVPNRAALPTATAPVIIVETAAPTRSTATPTASPLPTAATATATPLPTATSIPTFPPAAPTMAPSADVRVSFTAEDWIGGYYRGDSQAYGRPWMAVYGALSEHPRAALAFTLERTPGRPATISITGLDDEWAELNPITLEVNGQQVFSGPSPFANWDGVGSGENAAWTTVSFTIPNGVLRAGPNEIAVANLTPSASFDAPPYVLLADAILEISSQAIGDAPTTPSPVPIVPSDSAAVFAAEDWAGAFHRGDDRFYGRPWAAIYGAASAYPRATLRFRLDAAPGGPATLTLTGLDDELAASNPIAIEVNGQQAFSGPSPFLSWDGIGNGENAAWTEVTVTIAAELLREGRNEIAIVNLSPSANFGAPPYILLADATLQAPGAAVTARDANDSPRQRERRGDDDNDDDDDDGDDDGDDD